jgi:unsaturated rhamnogalacturonyl hydrolase
MKRVAFVIILLLAADLCIGQTSDKGMFLVTRNYRTRPEKEKATIVLDYKQLQTHKIIPETGDFDVTDGNFGRRLSKKVVDTNSDSQPDAVVIEYVFESDEPIFSFSVRSNGKSVSTEKAKASADPRLAVTYLLSYNQLKKSGKDISSWPDKIIESTMSFYPDPATLPIYAPGNWSYEYAFFLHAMFARWQETKKPEYFNYVKKWCDRFIDSHGALDPKHYNVADYRLDDMLPGRLFISLYEVTKDNKYKGAAAQLRQQLQYQPRTSDGGYWHKQIYPYQMWLDGVYMADIFTMQYAKAFNEPSLFKESMQQIRLVREHNGDAGTGLLYHGWDEAGNNVWANEETGTSPEFWSRGIGWYLMALIDCIDYVPLESPDRKELGSIFKDLSKSVLKYQDPKTGLWYQVINKGYEPRNWHETSATAMLAYAFAKGANKAALDKSYMEAAQKAFDAMKDQYIFFDDQQRLYLDGTVKIGTLNVKTSKGDLDYYVSTEKRINDYKGLGALLYLTQELD